MLCENTFNGGYGYTPAQVGDMTIDQIYMLFADKQHLRATGKQRTAAVPAELVKMRADGTVAGVAADGTPIRGTLVGDSLAKKLWDAHNEKKKNAEKQPAKKRKSQR